MNYIDYFMPRANREALIKPRFVAIEADWELLCNVFPEPGFRSYFLGHIVSKLATELKEHGITSYSQRAERPEFANLPRLLSHIRLTGEADSRHDGCGTGRTCNEDALRAGESASDALPTSGQAEESKVGKVPFQDRPLPAGPLSVFPLLSHDINSSSRPQ